MKHRIGLGMGGLLLLLSALPAGCATEELPVEAEAATATGAEAEANADADADADADAEGEAVGEAQQAFSVCNGPTDPDCYAQPDANCGYTTGACPANMHSRYRECWANCGDYDYKALVSGQSACHEDGGANAIFCDPNTDAFTTCDATCPTGYVRDFSQPSPSDPDCVDTRIRIACKKYVSDSFQLQHVGGMCVHPLGGSPTPANNTSAVLFPLCSGEPRLKFRLLSNGSLQHVSSGMCLHPFGGSERPAVGTPLVYFGECSQGAAADAAGNKKLRFEFTSGGSLRHVNSGLCVHPQGGSANPAVETRLVLWNICNEPRLQFKRL